MKHVEHRITTVWTGYTLQIMQKICINQKGFGQGMGAANAQNQVKQLEVSK